MTDSAQSDSPLGTPCLVCNAPVGQPCRTTGAGIVRAPHVERELVAALGTVRRLGEDLIESRDLLAQTVDTLRCVLGVVSMDQPYPWDSGALKQQIREDITAFELLGLDWPVPERAR